MNLNNHVHPGKYRLGYNMSNYALAALLRSGKQEPVNLKCKLAAFRICINILNVSGTLVLIPPHA